MPVDLFQILNSKGPVSLAVQSQFAGILKHRSLRKKEFFLKPGQINDTMVFIQKGLMRAYYMKDGVEIGSWFRSEGEFIVSISSFYLQKLSVEYVQAVEPTDILYVTHPELFKVYRENPDFCLNALLFTIDVLVEWDERCRALNSTSAEERFKWLMVNRPDLLDRVPAKYIAGFLGITPETFSKKKSMLYKEWPKEKK